MLTQSTDLYFKDITISFVDRYISSSYFAQTYWIFVMLDDTRSQPVMIVLQKNKHLQQPHAKLHGYALLLDFQEETFYPLVNLSIWKDYNSHLLPFTSSFYYF